MIDTGSTFNIIHPSLCQNAQIYKYSSQVSYSKSNISIQNKIFADLKFCRLKLGQEFLNEKIYGILGMDFFQNHMLIIDFINKKVFIGN